MCKTGTSPHTYDQQQVRPGDNQVRIRAKCPGQSGGAVVKVLRIGMLSQNIIIITYLYILVSKY